MKLTKLLPLILMLGLAACSDDGSTADVPAAAEKGALDAVILAEAPLEPMPIATLRESAKPGDEVVFHGSVLGSHTVFMDGRAVMTVGDPAKLTACNKKPDDHCETPWDVCCDDPEVIKASIVTVQVLDESGKPTKSGLKGVGGLTELSDVTVKGVVSDQSNAENMVINASGIYVTPAES